MRAWRYAEALGATVGVVALWFVILFVIPGVLALYIARLFPLTGQWRQRWRASSKRSPWTVAGLLLILVAAFSAFCIYFFFPVDSPTTDGQRVYDVDLAADRQFGLIGMGLLALVGIGLAVFGRLTRMTVQSD